MVAVYLAGVVTGILISAIALVVAAEIQRETERRTGLNDQGGGPDQ